MIRDKKRKTRKPGRFLRLSFVLAGICFVVSVTGLLQICHEYKKNQRIYERAQKEYTRPQKKKQNQKERHLQVNFKDLQKKYPDAAAWLYIPDVLSYPVMYCGDNTTYLDRSYNGLYDPAGSLFLDQKCDPDLSDQHMILYGHNMKDGSMFGSLKQYMRRDHFLKEHPCFYLYGPGQERKYTIVSCRQVDWRNAIYTVYKKTDGGYGQFAREILGLSSEKSNTKSVTLSTCSTEDKRFVITGILQN